MAAGSPATLTLPEPGGLGCGREEESQGRPVLVNGTGSAATHPPIKSFTGLSPKLRYSTG